MCVTYIPRSCNDGRSFGVVLWEIVTFGEIPLKGMSSHDIVSAAQDGVLCHSRSVVGCSAPHACGHKTTPTFCFDQSGGAVIALPVVGVGISF